MAGLNAASTSVVDDFGRFMAAFSISADLTVPRKQLGPASKITFFPIIFRQNNSQVNSQFDDAISSTEEGKKYEHLRPKIRLPFTTDTYTHFPGLGENRIDQRF